VSDNGCGFDPRRMRPESGRHRSIGLDNIRERMELSGGRLDIFSRPGLGTAVRITIKEEGEA
ncbi:sensor histidine kinase, partial [Klebsiella oxytoca]